MALVCDVCLDHFDLNCHRPKGLPCGHTICSTCVLHPALGRKCPVCRKDLATDPNGFPDNILAIRMLEDGGAQHDNEAVGTDANLQQLQRGVEAGRKVVQLLRQVVPMTVESLNNYVESTVAQLRQMEEALDRLQQQVAAGEESAPRRPVAVAVKQLQTVAHLEDSLRLLSASKVSIVAEEAEASWRACVQLGPFDLICRLLLLQLRADGQLQKAGAAEAATPAAYIGPPKLSVLRVIDTDYDDDANLEVESILRDRRRWKNTRILQNLGGANAEELLQALKPHLHIEELEYSETVAGPWVLEEVQKITSLKKLIVSCDPGLGDYPDLPLHLALYFLPF